MYVCISEFFNSIISVYITWHHVDLNVCRIRFRLPTLHFILNNFLIGFPHGIITIYAQSLLTIEISWSFTNK